MINLELYRVFHEVAKSGSLTAAAKELFITQPALSQTILNLESQLGGQLFVRTRKGMILTPEGEKMYAGVSDALDSIKSAENSFMHMKRLDAGYIRIGAGDTLCRHFLLKYITLFHKDYPGINIEVTNRTTSETMALLRAGKVDVAFVNLPADAHEFNVHECIQLNDCFAGNESYKSLPVMSAEQMMSMPLIAMETSSNTRRFMDNYMKKLGVKMKPEIELGSFDLVVEFTKAGLGIGCVTKEFIKKELEEQTLFEIKTDFVFPSRAIGGITRKDTSLTFAALKFIEIVYDKNAFSQQ